MVQYIVFVEGEMKNRKFIKQNRAVAGVIEALLLVGLVAVILSVIQLVYIPQIMEQREAEHMDEVANQFSFLKAIIDLQSIEKKDVPISSPITLGSRELPYFITARALGELKIITGEDYNITGGMEVIIPLTSIKYTALNSYYLDGGVVYYVLEGGAIILKQPDGEKVIVEPTINVVNSPTAIDIYYDIPIIIGISGKDISPQDYKTCFIRTNYSHEIGDESPIYSINITTEYPDAWNSLLHNISNLADDVDIKKGSNYVLITMKTKQINLHYNGIYIYAQISPGWIK